MTILINLLGQPSAGKSTTMGHLFSELKYMEKQVEMCPEWVKRMANDGIVPTKYDQPYIMGKEIKQQSRLLNKVDYIISDSPVYLSSFYHYNREGDNRLLTLADMFYGMLEEDGHTCYNFFLKRNKNYNPVGRYQDEAESDLVAIDLQNYLEENLIPYTFLDCKDKSRVDEIIKHLGLTL